MNIFSNIGVTELVLILLLALIVVGPERLPEVGQKIGKTLRDVRKAYDNLARDIGPELASLQETTRELRQSVQAVQSIPQDAVKSLVKAADLEDTVTEISGMAGTVSEVGRTLSSTGKMLSSPVSAAVSTAQATLLPKKPDRAEVRQETEPGATEAANGETQVVSTSEPEPSIGVASAEATHMNQNPTEGVRQASHVGVEIDPDLTAGPPEETSNE